MRGPVCGEGKAGFFGEVGLGAVAGGDGVLGRHYFCFWDCEEMEARSTSKSIVQPRSPSVESVYNSEGEMMTNSPNNFFTSILRERDMNNRGLPPQFDVLDGECGGARLCSSKEIEM